MTTRDTTATIQGIYIAAPDRVVVAGVSSIQFWDGARYTVTLSSTNGYSAWGTGPSDIWVGSDSGVYRYNGSSWSTPGISGLSGGVIGIHGTAANDVYFVSESNSQIFRWDGAKFNSVAVAGLGYGKTAVYATPTRVFVTSSRGEVITGLGSSWSSVVDVDGRLSEIIGFAADKAWVGGSYGYVLSYKP